MKIVTVVGARPQFIKAATVSRQIGLRDGLKEILVHTGQHYDSNMSDIFFSEMEIPKVGYHLGIGSATHGAQTGQMLESIERVLLAESPDWVLIYGDTNSTLAGAIAACKLHIPVAHIEAGLRSFNRRMPEEINRILADHASDLLFAPTETAVSNLAREGVSGDKVVNVGDVMYDAALYYGAKAEKTSKVLKQLEIEQESYILATCHRAENTDDEQRLRALFGGLYEVAAKTPVVLPLHPRTRGSLDSLGMLEGAREKIKLIDPVGYLDMVMLEKHAALVVTDSGGVQKEAFFYEAPCVTLRDETEWIELVKLGWNRLVPPTSTAVVAEGIREGLGTRGEEGQPYGRGDAAERIVDVLVTAGK